MTPFRFSEKPFLLSLNSLYVFVEAVGFLFISSPRVNIQFERSQDDVGSLDKGAWSTKVCCYSIVAIACCWDLRQRYTLLCAWRTLRRTAPFSFNGRIILLELGSLHLLRSERTWGSIHYNRNHARDVAIHKSLLCARHRTFPERHHAKAVIKCPIDVVYSLLVVIQLPVPAIARRPCRADASREQCDIYRESSYIAPQKEYTCAPLKLAQHADMP